MSRNSATTTTGKQEFHMRIGILHPGEMGISVAASAKNSGCDVYWVSKGRSAATRERAVKFGLREVQTLEQLTKECPIVLSVCPPHAAETVAREVLDTGFRGLFVDANAIAPQRTIQIGNLMARHNASFVDGGIIGVPAWKAHTTCLYLSGERASEVAACFLTGPLDTKVLGKEIGKASALKMCYAANTKGTVALLAGIVATAEILGVREALFEQWRSEDAAQPEQVVKRIQNNAPKAWRFVAEMKEISQTFSDARTPGGFHLAAADIYERLAPFRDAKSPPTLDEILVALCERRRRKPDETR
jgi:3-hydroxyisobutyrate dehydrogenase-like beta-hydroxyacid dehydrogenase